MASAESKSISFKVGRQATSRLDFMSVFPELNADVQKRNHGHHSPDDAQI